LKDELYERMLKFAEEMYYEFKERFRERGSYFEERLYEMRRRMREGRYTNTKKEDEVATMTNMTLLF
jgi:hypothetical protein